MTGKQRHDMSSQTHIIPPAIGNGVLLKKALSGLTWSKSDEKEIARQLSAALGTQAHNQRNQPETQVSHYMDAYVRQTRNKRLPPTGEGFYEYLMNCTSGSCPADIKAGQSKTGMSLPKQETTQMRNRAKKGNSVPVVVVQKKKKGKSKKRVSQRAGSMRIYSAPAAIGTEFSNDFKLTDVRTKGGRRIHFREPVGSLTGSSAWTNAWININPGDPSSFRWLSKIASGYEQYKIYSLRFWYAAGASSNEPGQAFVYPDYDPNDDQANNYIQAMENQNSTQFTPWKSMVGRELITDDIRRASPRLIYHGNMTNQNLGLNYPLYNFLSTWFAFQGGDGGTLGTLYLEYDIELLHETGESTSSALVSNKGADATTSSPLGVLTTNSVGSVGSAAIIGPTPYATLKTNDSLSGLKYNSAQPGLCDLTNQKFYFLQDFSGLVMFRIYGAMTGNTGSSQISSVYTLGQVSKTPNVVISNNSNLRVEVCTMVARAGASITISLSGGLTITTTAVSTLLLSGGDFGPPGSDISATNSQGYLAVQNFLATS